MYYVYNDINITKLLYCSIWLWTGDS